MSVTIRHDVKFVNRAFGDRGDEPFPDTRTSTGMQRMRTVIPTVEAADDRYLARIGRPHAETRALLAAYRGKVRAHLFISAVVAALIEKIKVLLGQKASLRTRVWVQRWVGCRHGGNSAISDSVPDLLAASTFAVCAALTGNPLEGRVLDFLTRLLAF